MRIIDGDDRRAWGCLARLGGRGARCRFGGFFLMESGAVGLETRPGGDYPALMGAGICFKVGA